MILNNKLLLNGILAFSILSLSIAYFIQYVLGHKPCNLCIIERIPYIAAIILISLIFILNRYQKIISSLILIFFVFGAAVSVAAADTFASEFGCLDENVRMITTLKKCEAGINGGFSKTGPQQFFYPA